MLGIPGIAALQHVLDAALRIDGAVCGDVQVPDDAHRILTMVAWRGFPDDYAERYRTIRVGDGTPCTHALTERRRICIRDVSLDAGFAPHSEGAKAIGYHALQSTPLTNSTRKLVGVLTTHFPVPHHPAPASQRQLDRCCRVAARLIEVEQLVNGTRPQMSTEAARAVDALRILLPLLGETGNLTVADDAARHLDVVIRELKRSIN